MDVVLDRKKYTIQDILPNHLYRVTDSDLNDGKPIATNPLRTTNNKLFMPSKETTRAIHRPGHTDTSLFQKNINKELFINEPVISVIETGPENSKRERVILNTEKQPMLHNSTQKKTFQTLKNYSNPSLNNNSTT